VNSEGLFTPLTDEWNAHFSVVEALNSFKSPHPYTNPPKIHRELGNGTRPISRPPYWKNLVTTPYQTFHASHYWLPFYLPNFQKHPHQPSFYASRTSTYPPYRREPTATRNASYASKPRPENKLVRMRSLPTRERYLKKADEEASAHETER
jgi:hypothetical protein